MKLVFGIFATMLVLYLIHSATQGLKLLKTHKASIRDLLQIISSLGLVLPIECFILYIFISFNGVNGLSESAFTSSFAVSSNMMFTVVGQQAFIVNAMKLLSAIALGSAVAFTVTYGITTVIMRKKAKNKGTDFEQNDNYEQVKDVRLHNNPGYLQFCRFLS